MLIQAFSEAGDRMSTKKTNVVFVSLFLLFNSLVLAAPLPPCGPYQISGKIADLKWYPERKVKGIPGMSGSTGRDRTFSAHFLVKLNDYKGIDSNNAIQITRNVDPSALKNKSADYIPDFVTLMINHNGKRYLKKGMTILVKGYTVRGDEGGTWSDYTEVDILKHNSTEDSIEHYLETFILKPEYGGEVFCAYEIYGKELKQRQSFFYLWALCSEYYMKEGVLTMGSAISVPLVLISKDVEYGSAIKEHKMPSNGEKWGEDVRRLFPKKHHKDIFAQGDGFNRRGDELLSITKKKAMCYYNLVQCLE